MELVMSLVIGVMFAGGTYMILRPSLIRIVMGFALYSNAANLTMIVCGGFSATRGAPFVSEGADLANLMDPLPPDIILTAIVISFAVGALLLTVCYRVYLDHGTDDPERLPTDQDEQPSVPVPDVLAELARPSPDSPHEGRPEAMNAVEVMG